ncbi:hypothetical protein [Gordonia sp. MP11Mi]|uniref:Uncharacterized protein n=1 Tax=Gordonia sp. MP11Mi TaxID=3022769 RepID=A0AA97CXE8_9ACTN
MNDGVDRSLRIDRAASLLVLHGRRGDREGFAQAVADLTADGADLALVAEYLWPALRTTDDQLATMVSTYVFAEISDRDDDGPSDG